jgi:hypothetical protein
MSITELQEQRGRLVTAAREALDEIKSNTDEAAPRNWKAATTRSWPTSTSWRPTSPRRARRRRRGPRRRGPRQAAPEHGRRRPRREEPAKPEYRDAFLQLARAGFDVQEISPEARAVLRAGHVAKVEGRSQTVGTNSAGGYTVPTELAAVIDKTLKMWGPMYDEAICTVLNTASGNPIDFPTVDDTAVTISQHTEAVAMTDDGSKDATFAKMTLNAFAYDTSWVQISMELLQDSNVDIGLHRRTARRADGASRQHRTDHRRRHRRSERHRRGFHRRQDRRPDHGVHRRRSDRPVHSVDPAYRASPKARFMFHDTVLAAIRKLKDGQGQYIWSMGDIRSGQPGTLLGNPYSVNQAMSSAFTTGQKLILFGDFSKYYVRKVGAPVIGVRREYYWPNIGLAGVVRLDGDLIQTSAVKHLKLA